MKKLSLAYLAFLTLLLVVRNPLDLFGRQQVVVAAYSALGFVIHFLTFFILGVLMSAARWSLGTLTLLLLLVVYAAATEIVQWFVPGRAADWIDFGQDVAGVLLGIATYHAAAWTLQRIRQGRTPAEQPEEPTPAR